MRKLQMIFKSENGKVKSLSLDYASDSLSGPQVEEQMNKISTLNMFNSDGTILYKTPLAAKYIQTDTDVLFDNRK